jgi:hypothetical protein
MKFNTKGYTNYPNADVCRPCEVLSYDGSKYCWIRFLTDDLPTHYGNGEPIEYRNGNELEIKRGYIGCAPYNRDFDDYKALPRITWWILQGRDRRNFTPLVKKREWKTWDSAKDVNPTGTKAEMIKLALRLAKERGEDIEVWQSVTVESNSGYSGDSGGVFLVVQSNGVIAQYDNQVRHRGKGGRLSGTESKSFLQPKYLRGHGKAANHPRQPVQAWEQRRG